MLKNQRLSYKNSSYQSIQMKPSKEQLLEDLIEGCRKRDRRSQKRLYEKYFGVMMTISMRYCKNWEEAMEVLNTAFLKIFTRIDDYKGLGSFEGWMKKTVVNTALDHLKKDHLKYAVEINERDMISTDLFIENEAVSELNVDELMKVIQEIPTMSRTVFNLYVFEGLKHKDISEVLGISEGTCHWHLQNARTILKTKLTRY